MRVLVLGATSGIAMATTRLLARKGCAFYLVARDGCKLAAVAADLQVRGASAVHSSVCDLNLTELHPTLLTQAAEALGEIDLALLAHGVLGDQRAAEADYEVAQSLFITNLLSPVSLITWLANYFERREAGTLVVLSSVAGDRGRKSNYVYGTTKGALTIFLQGVRNRLNSSGAHVLTVKPGFVATPMTAHLDRNLLFADPDRVARSILSAVRSRKNEVYVPWFWRGIMCVIRAIPESIFKRLNL